MKWLKIAIAVMLMNLIVAGCKATQGSGDRTSDGSVPEWSAATGKGKGQSTQMSNTDPFKSGISPQGGEAAISEGGDASGSSGKIDGRPTPDGSSHNAGSSAVPGNEGGGISQTDEDLVPYHGPIEHIFFHPLVIYPELAFDGDRMSRGYDDWFVTVKEFKAIIDSLYKHNFMLIDLNSIYELQEADGKKQTKAKELRLPKGKKPIVLSIDDMNYYDYMLQNGNANKLVIDDNGEIATYSVSPKGEKITSRDNEIVPILDDFVKVHPDFSLNGAKGLIALTGYEGVLGYRTNKKDAPNYEEEKQGALRIIDRLKSTGWSFASHGYGHLDARKVGLDRLTEDTARWKDEVETLTGPTNIYVYPFGSSVLPGDPKYAALLKAGFTVLCSVGPAPYLKWMPDSLMMDRRHIDGIALKTQQSKLVDMFDANEVLDPVRAELLDSMH